MSEYKVKFEVFEGPLDLLLYLIKKQEVDIYEVNLTQLATQFIEYIEVMRMLDLEIAGEFLVMASTLMYIKSRELLPVDQQVEVEEEDEGEDPALGTHPPACRIQEVQGRRGAVAATWKSGRKMFIAAKRRNPFSSPNRRSRTFRSSISSTRSTPSSSAWPSAKVNRGRFSRTNGASAKRSRCWGNSSPRNRA